MAGSSNSKTPDMAEELMISAIEKRKTALEDEVFHKVLRFWEKLYELEYSLYVEGIPTPKHVALMRKYRRRLHVADHVDIFTHEGVYALMLQRELKILEDIAGSDSFGKTSTETLTGWLYQWRVVVEDEYLRVLSAHFF